jgi:DNA-binding CsgD family transcriptional regulator
VDPEQKRVPPLEVMRTHFGLTLTEARLAEQLAAGKSVTNAAEALLITEETVRTHLKSILSKTDTHRQGQLIALLASFAIIPPGNS